MHTHREDQKTPFRITVHIYIISVTAHILHVNLLQEIKKNYASRNKKAYASAQINQSLFTLPLFVCFYALCCCLFSSVALFFFWQAVIFSQAFVLSNSMNYAFSLSFILSLFLSCHSDQVFSEEFGAELKCLSEAACELSQSTEYSHMRLCFRETNKDLLCSSSFLLYRENTDHKKTRIHFTF